MVATRPDPTVRPPSRFNKFIFRRVFGAFNTNFHGNIIFIAHYLFITLISWHRFGTGNAAMILSYLLGNFYYCFDNRKCPYLLDFSDTVLQTCYKRTASHYASPHLTIKTFLHSVGVYNMIFIFPVVFYSFYY